MLGKEKDLNIQLKPQQILETKQTKNQKSQNKKKPTPIHVAELILNLHQSEARKYSVFETMNIILKINREAFMLMDFFSNFWFFFAVGRSIKESRKLQILNKPTFKIFTLEKYPTKWQPFSSFFVRT